MVTWFKKTLFAHFAKLEIKLSKEVQFAESVISSNRPEDVKAAVADILIQKKRRLTKISTCKEFFS